MKNWKKIGQVKIVFAAVHKYYDYTKKQYVEYKELNFDTLPKAVEWLGCGHIQKLEYGRLGVYWAEDINNRYPVYVEICKGDELVVRDEMGIDIPIWKLKETFNNLPRDCKVRRQHYRSRYRHKRSKYIKNERADQKIGSFSVGIPSISQISFSGFSISVCII